MTHPRDWTAGFLPSKTTAPEGETHVRSKQIVTLSTWQRCATTTSVTGPNLSITPGGNPKSTQQAPLSPRQSFQNLPAQRPP